MLTLARVCQGAPLQAQLAKLSADGHEGSCLSGCQMSGLRLQALCKGP